MTVILAALSLPCVILISFPGITAHAARSHGGSDSDDEGNSPIPKGAGYAFTVERDILTMPDGVKLAVSYWMPGPKVRGEKFPVFFEMNGYRKDDLSYLSCDYPVGAYFARHGYVVAKVDLRGTGDSTGVLPEAEY